jgi:hypothetical protein
MRSTWSVSAGMVASSILLTLVAVGVWAHSAPAPAGSAADSAATGSSRPALPPAGASSGSAPAATTTAPSPNASGSAVGDVGGTYLEPLPSPTGQEAGGTAPAVSLPDPRPLVANERWVLNLVYRQGDMALRDVRKETVSPAAAVPRRMGRFVLELLVGAELLERTRFDFPLLGAGEYAGKRRWDAPPTFERFATSTVNVAVPNSARATRLMLIDRASGQAWKVPWPPTVPTRLPAPPASSAGTSAAAAASGTAHPQ